ncbi:MAG: prepilin-type N-terminal cleavage/methylation domain-containing protein [Deltaproteobacteria bacterium]|nr:prepilin-type N-terminal cleavage/methylation domain-containing protein [Deltaproteobacteria bacterium]
MRRASRVRGFSVVEALVASTILAVGTAAATSMLTLSMTTTRSHAFDAHAVALAEREMEDLRSLLYASIATRDPFPVNAPDVFNGAAFTVHRRAGRRWPRARRRARSSTRRSSPESTRPPPETTTAASRTTLASTRTGARRRRVRSSRSPIAARS